MVLASLLRMSVSRIPISATFSALAANPKPGSYVDFAGIPLWFFSELISGKEGAAKPPPADVITDFDLSRVSRIYGTCRGLALTAS